MTKPALQLNQLFADPLLAKSLKQGGGLLSKLGQNSSNNGGNPFSGLLSGLLSMRTNPLLDATPATPAASQATPMPGDLTQADILKGLPSELLALIQANNAARKSEDMADGILSALSSGPTASGQKQNLFAFIDDPELAASLANLASKLNLQHNAGALTASGLELNATNMADALAQLQIYSDTLQQDGTLTIADLNLDQFQLLKKLAFADIAPYLTQPRTIVVDGKSLLKIAQGPAFLNDTDTNLTELALNAGLSPAISLEGQHTDISLNAAAAAAAASASATNDTAALAAQSALSAANLAGPQTLSSNVNSATSPQQAGTPANAQGTAAQLDAFNQNTSGQNTSGQNTGGQMGGQMGSQTGSQNTQHTMGTQNAAALTAGANSTNSESRGFGDWLPTTLDTALNQLNLGVSAESFNATPTADALSPLNAATNLMGARSAGLPHATSHLVSLSIQRNLNPATPGTERSFTITMDPASLGRVQVTLQFGEGKTVKAHLVAERPETLSLLQRDISLLERTLNASGLDTSDTDSFTFDLAKDDGFTDSLKDGSEQENAKNSTKNQSDDDFGTLHANEDISTTQLPIFTDPETGRTHVNIVI